MKVGYIGLGAMGRALARHLAGPYDLLVWDLNPAAIADLEDLGATGARSLAEMGQQCEVVILCLPKSSNVEQALFGDGGIAKHLSRGSVVVDQTSGIPATTREFADRLAERGIGLIDAPVAGGVPSAIAGQITIMASGPKPAFDKTQEILGTISSKVFHCSERVGDGQATKAINNLINTGYRMTSLELLGLARRMGCSAAAVTEACNAGHARSFVTQRLLPAIVEGRSSADFALGLMVKDVNQAADFALATHVPMPISDAARSLMNVALALLGQESRLDDLVPFMERVTGADFAGQPGEEETQVGEGLRLVELAMAASNRAIMLENLKLAKAAGLDMDGFAPVIASGSGASAQGDLLFSPASEAPLDGALEALDAVSRKGAELGVPLTMTNQIRAHYLGA
ncbi:hypothetical protein NRB_06970 [Novosphingobium sp. 11B]